MQQSSYDQYVVRDPDFRSRIFRTYKPGVIHQLNGTSETFRFQEEHPLRIIQRDLVRKKFVGHPERSYVRVSLEGLGTGFILPSAVRKPWLHPNRTRKVSTVGGQSFHELAFISKIRTALKQKGTVDIRFTSGFVLDSVTAIEVPGRQDTRGHAPYTDVLIYSTTRCDPFRVSLKSRRPADWFGGGRRTIIRSNPDLFRRMVSSALSGSQGGDLRVDLDLIQYRETILQLIQGDYETGGPNDLIIVGDEDVRARLVGSDLWLDQDAFSPEGFVDQVKSVTLRVRRRTHDMMPTDETDPDGIPYVFRKGGCVGRWVFECRV